MPPRAVPVPLLALPPLAEPLFGALAAAGLRDCCIFGGAVRDADCSAAWGRDLPIKDYDARVWLGGESERAALARLERALGCSPRSVPAGGTPHLRHLFLWRGDEIDLSLRSAPPAPRTPPSASRSTAPSTPTPP